MSWSAVVLVNTLSTGTYDRSKSTGHRRGTAAWLFIIYIIPATTQRSSNSTPRRNPSVATGSIDLGRLHILDGQQQKRTSTHHENRYEPVKTIATVRHAFFRLHLFVYSSLSNGQSRCTPLRPPRLPSSSAPSRKQPTYELTREVLVRPLPLQAGPPGFTADAPPAAAADFGCFPVPAGDTAAGTADATAAAGALPRRTVLPPAAPVDEQQDCSAGSLDDECQEGQECFYWDWKWKSKISYVRRGSSGPVLLLCHGFGVGSHHFEDNIPALSEKFQVFAVDLLGQGQSWPSQPTCAESGPLRYNVDTWTEQLQHFIEAKIKQPCYIAGNSLGGFLGVTLAYHHPELVKGLVLLNAAPAWNFWCSAPPASRATWLHKLLPINGTVPAPKPVKATIGSLWFDIYRQPAIVRSVLGLVYGRTHAIDDELVSRIIQATEHPEAVDAFASIVLSPEAELSFEEMVQGLSCPVCLAYGASDPWIIPLWGQRVKRWLPHAQYYELACVGHCPHHEAPSTVNQIISSWVEAVEDGRQQHSLLQQAGSTTSYEEADGSWVEVTCVPGTPRNLVEQLDDAAFVLRRAVGLVLRRITAPGAFF